MSQPGVEKERRYGDEVAGEKDWDAFYIVDLPGFGYAKVRDDQRDEWKAFQRSYFRWR